MESETETKEARILLESALFETQAAFLKIRKLEGKSPSWLSRGSIDKIKEAEEAISVAINYVAELRESLNGYEPDPINGFERFFPSEFPKE